MVFTGRNQNGVYKWLRDPRPTVDLLPAIYRSSRHGKRARPSNLK